jgi:putative ABC transport system permease protein
MLVRNPGVTLVAALSLALGIGVNSAMFSLHDALMLRPLPVRNADGVLTVTADSPDEPGGGRLSYANYRDLREQSRTFDLIAFQQTAQTFATSRDAARDVRLALLVSDNFFDVLGVRPALGRSFTPSEGQVPNRDAVVVLGYDFWTHTLGGDPSIVGRSVLINGVDFTVIGVAPERFTGMDVFLRPSFYAPIMMSERLISGALQRGGSPVGHAIEDRSVRTFVVKGRVKSGESQQTAEAELARLWDGLVREYPDANRNRPIAVRSELRNRIRNDPANASVIAMMTTLAGVLLVIACANVANLLLGRARARAREMAIRLAMGVSRTRLLRQLLIEAVVLATIGCGLGLWVAYGGILFLSYSIHAVTQTDLPLEITPQLDLRVVGFSLIATLASAVFFGLSPAWHSLKTDLIPALKSAEPGQTARQRTIGRNVLVVSQVALSMVLLVAAAMLVGGFRSTLGADPGFRAERRITMRVDTVFGGYAPDQTHTFYRDLVDRARAVPGISSVALASAAPFDGNVDFNQVRPEGFQFPRGNESATVLSAVVDEHYFATLAIPITRGRAFTAFDTPASPLVAVVNEAFANTYWPGQEPIGKRLQLPDRQGSSLEVVGVTRTGKYTFLGEGQTPFLYLPFAQHERSQMSLIAETTGSSETALAAALRQVVRSIDVSQPVFDLRSLERLYEQRGLGPPLMVMRVLSAISVLGLSLALVGLYSLVAYSVSRRTREIGLRMAMGASHSHVLKMVLRQGLMLSLVGVVTGAVVSVFVGRLLTSVLAGLATPNPFAYGLVPITLIGMTIAASYVPARRAASIDPLRALRDE